MSARAVLLGIDPGVNGALAWLDQAGRLVAVADMPTAATGPNGRRQLDPAALARLLIERPATFAMLEKVGTRPGEGAVGAFSFGVSWGTVAGALAALGIAYDTPTPQQWRRAIGLAAGTDKSASIATAARLIPGGAAHLTRKKDDGRAEAMLLAEVARRRRSGAP